MKLKYRHFLWMLLLLPLLTFAAAPAAAEETAYQGEYTAVQSASREFEVTFSAWTGNAASAGELKPSTVMLLIDVSGDSMLLEGSPGSEATFQAGTSTKSMDINTVLYTLYEGAYQEVRLFDKKWSIVEYRDGKATAGTLAVGNRSSDGLTDSFLFDVYQPAGVKNRLSYIKESTVKLIQETAALSPNSKIGLIFFGDTLQVTEPLTLTKANTDTLIQAVSGCESYVSGSAQNITALKEAAALLLAQEEEHSLGIVNISAGCQPAANEEDADAVQKAAQDIRMDGIKIYAAGLYEGTVSEEDGSAFVEAVASPGFSQVVAADGLDAVMESYMTDFLAGSSVTVAAVLDPRFTLSNTERDRLRAEEISVEIRDDGVTVIEWQAGMPRTREAAWTASVQLTVKLDFPGGNDIPVCGEGSGIYKTGALVYSFSHQMVNVGMDMEMYDLEAEIFLGQRVPVMLGGDDLQSRMVKNSSPNWYGKGETGTFTYLWQEKDGGKIGQKEQLQEVTPTKSQTYVLTMTYTPKTDGRTAVGESVDDLQNSAEYTVAVQTGTVRIKMVLDDDTGDDAAGDFYIFRLESDNHVQYRILNMKDRSEDAESLCLETAFTGLPYGKYTVSRVYAFVSRAGIFDGAVTESECMIGYQAGSDIIDVNASEFTVVTKADRPDTNKSKAFALTTACTYSIDFSSEGESDS